MIVLTSADNEIFTVSRAVAARSALLKNMLEDIGLNMDVTARESNENSDDSTPIPVPNIKGSVLKKVIEYCDHYKDEPLPEPVEDWECYDLDDRSTWRRGKISKWDSEFINVENEMLFGIILAANYLDIKPLLDLGCKTVASMIRGRTPEELRKRCAETSKNGNDLKKDDNAIATDLLNMYRRP